MDGWMESGGWMGAVGDGVAVGPSVRQTKGASERIPPPNHPPTHPPNRPTDPSLCLALPSTHPTTHPPNQPTNPSLAFTARTCMMKLTSCAVGCGVMVMSDCESVVPASVQPSQGRKKRTLCGCMWVGGVMIL